MMDSISDVMRRANMDTFGGERSQMLIRALNEVLSRADTKDDLYKFRATDKSPDEIVAKSNLYLDVERDFHLYDEKFVTISIDEIMKISRLTKNYESFKTSVLIYMFIISNVYMKTYTLSDDTKIKGGYAILTYADIANALGMDEHTVSKYAALLYDNEIITVFLGHGTVRTQIYYPANKEMIAQILAKAAARKEPGRGSRALHKRYGGIL